MPPRYQEHCNVSGCDRPFHSRGYCSPHYRRFMRFGDVLADVEPKTEGDLPAAFWRKVDKRGPDECWPWTASRRNGTYGQIRFNHHNLAAHRVAWELTRGPIPEKYQVDHLCRNIICCNPAHLEPVTQQENLRRQWVAMRAARQEKP